MTTHSPEMPESAAADKADALLALLIEHQPNLFGSVQISSEEVARNAARNLVALRTELIVQLLKK